MDITVRAETFPIAGVFAISRGARTEARVLTVEIRAGGLTGRGECVPYARYGETPEGVAAAIEGLPGTVDRATLQTLLPPGPARNALDCALWDLEARQSGRRVWELAGLPPPGPVPTAYTLSLGTPEAMRQAAETHRARPLLKVKLGGGAEDPERLRAVRAGAPEARLIVDANEGWTPALYAEMVPHLAAAGVALVEQPLPAGADAVLAELPRPVPVCADESCHNRASLPALIGRYDMINVKLDKTGGLTEALALIAEARRAGFGVMVGCMLGPSLAMTPAVLAAQGAAVTDLDGPLLLARDRAAPLRYDAAGVHPPEPELWG